MSEPTSSPPLEAPAPPAICRCEAIVHFVDECPTSEWHAYGAAVESGLVQAQEVGLVCRPCADTHLADFVRRCPNGHPLEEDGNCSSACDERAVATC